ncbi:MAG: peptidoglycan DD-metalloendopeptidase family protein [Clostridia bacterium]|nr:peptidoglycan DD-metalloendopeptidase family protein [Clostridia bacterium]
MTDIKEKLNTPKNRITIISVLAFVVAICCIFAFAGKTADEAVVSSSLASSEEVISEASENVGFGLYIDGNLVAALENEADANAALDEVLDIRASSLGLSSEAKVSFNNKVELIKGEYPEEAFVDTAKACELLGKKNAYNVSDKVLSYSGEALPVKLSVRSVITYSETVTLEYEVKKVYTDSMKNGVEKVLSKGYNGEGEETYEIVSVDGVVSERNVLSLDITVAPSDEIIRIGTQSNGITVASLGTFIKPYDGVVTSYTGPRWGRTHNGIDIAGDRCNGKPAVAACDGVVVRADWYGGYGNCVIIDHGNGVQTLYAHLSAFSVQVGDVLTAGDEVGKIGSTGNSTGPHLHFEVHVDGEIVNPLIFVDYDD